MAAQKNLYENLVKSLACFFHPMVEVTLLNQENRECCTFNRLTHHMIPELIPNKIVQLSINKKQLVKVICIPLSQEYSLRIMADISAFNTIHQFLNHFLTVPAAEGEIVEQANWQELIQHVIDEYCKQNHTTVPALTLQDKRIIVLHAYEKSLFRYQDASKYLAHILNVSRATIYNYLNQASQLKTLQIHQVDAFTDEPFSGNPAGVVLEANQLSDAMMKKITREMNLSETAFLFPSKKANIKIRYFTPTGAEVKFCGHSTVATLFMLAHKKMLGLERPGYYDLKLEAKVGIIKTAVELKNDGGITVLFQTPKIDLIKSKITHAELAEALGIPLDVIDIVQPIMFEKTNQDLFVTIKSLKYLGALQVDMKSAKQFSLTHNIVALALLCNQTVSKRSHIHMRCYAPAVGIPEDPFTGSVLGGLSAYIIQNHLIAGSLKTIRIEQGHFINRPGYVDLTINQSKPQESPMVAAKAHHFFSTEIKL